jgi:two-component SAPR family response regulator
MDTTDTQERLHDPTEAVCITAIDDDEINLALIASVLSGYNVTTYSSPRLALEAFQGGITPELIVCDVTMPGLDGFGLHEALREIPALRSVPFIFLTALDDRDNLRRGMGQGADDYLTKPFTPAELREAVRTRLQRADRLRDDAERELIVTSLGGLGLSTVGRRLQWEAKKVVELLLFLLDQDGHSTFQQARSELWWKFPADNHLHVLISRLRKTLGDLAGVEVLGDSIELRHEGSLRWDARTFERSALAALDEGSVPPIEQAIALYGGTFLADFESPWAERRRGELEELYLKLLEAAIDLAPEGLERERAEGRWGAYIDME